MNTTTRGLLTLFISREHFSNLFIINVKKKKNVAHERSGKEMNRFVNRMPSLRLPVGILC